MLGCVNNGLREKRHACFGASSGDRGINIPSLADYEATRSAELSREKIGHFEVGCERRLQCPTRVTLTMESSQ